MGMDVYGKKPKTEHGAYFRNNVWWWHPLWDYCCFIEPNLFAAVPHGHSNSGDGLDNIESRKLGLLLQSTVENGTAAAYIADYEKRLEELPLQDCPCTKWPDDKTCSQCKGTKKVKDFRTWYSISVENIADFSRFCLECGGFKIC